jgi:hypothetical protein
MIEIGEVSTQNKDLQKELSEFRYLYNRVVSRINKLEDDTKAAIEFADLAEDDRGTEMILEFCEDITKLVGE